VGRFRLVIFDYDGTLFDTRSAIIHCILRALEHRSRAIPARDAVADIVGKGETLPDTLLRLDPGLRHDPAERDELVLTYRRFYRDESTALLQAFPGVAETLEGLHLSGIPCAVVSNKGIDALHRSLEETGLSLLIDFVVGDQPGTPKKPDPLVVTDLIVPRFRLHRDEMLIVGDTEVDIVFAKRTGIASCWASYGYGAPAHCRALEPDYEISGISYLREIITEAVRDAPIRPHYDGLDDWAAGRRPDYRPGVNSDENT
jgi:phosphoglycolate phosphatase